MDEPRRARIRRWLPAAGVALAVALAGCSETSPSDEVSAGSGGSVSSVSRPPTASVAPTEPATTSPATEPTGSGGSTEPANPSPGGTLNPRAGEQLPPLTTVPGDRRHPQQWESYTVAADDRTLTFTYYAGVEPCSVFDSIVADEGPDAARVTIFERSGPDGVACIMLAQQKSATVTLQAPLAGRPVV